MYQHDISTRSALNSTADAIEPNRSIRGLVSNWNQCFCFDWLLFYSWTIMGHTSHPSALPVDGKFILEVHVDTAENTDFIYSTLPYDMQHMMLTYPTSLPWGIQGMFNSYPNHTLPIMFNPNWIHDLLGL